MGFKHMRRLELIKLAGGCCVRCGYNKCRYALEFHHREPEKKRFKLSGDELSHHSWQELLNKLEKYDLLSEVFTTFAFYLEESGVFIYIINCGG